MRSEFVVAADFKRWHIHISRSFHYLLMFSDIPSCSGCKTFFRRSILTTPNYICKNDKCCQNLKGCRACRFDRCLMVGMNPNGILIPPKSNVYQIQSFIKKHQNRMFSKATLQRSHNEMPRLFTVLGLEQNKSLQYLLYLESKICLLRMSGDYNPVQLFECSVKDLMKKEVELAKTDKYSIVSKHQGIKLYLLIDIILCMDASRLLPGMDEMEERDLVCLANFHVRLEKYPQKKFILFTTFLGINPKTLWINACYFYAIILFLSTPF